MDMYTISLKTQYIEVKIQSTYYNLTIPLDFAKS